MARYIDADKLMEIFCEDCLYSSDCKDGYCVEREIVNSVPTEDVQPVVHGEWIDECPYLDIIQSMYSCSNCGARIDYPTNYCAKCGAKMR